jgi:hypothetical protein
MDEEAFARQMAVLDCPFTFYCSNPDLAREMLGNPVRHEGYEDEYRAAEEALEFLKG